jgi:hypothetical protein
VRNKELDADLQRPIIMIYLNKINRRQIFEPQAFEQIMNSVNNPELLVRILDEYICQAVAFNTAQTNMYTLQQSPNVISNLKIEARMNVYDRKVAKAPGEDLWYDRNYVQTRQKNTTHVMIAYFINQQITKEENRDPLEYFQQYRRTNSD